MRDTGGQEPDDTIGALFGQLVEDAGEVLRAELDLYRKAAVRRFTRSRSALAAAFAALFIAQAAVTTLLITLAIALAQSVGPLAAGIIVFVAALAIAVALVRFAIARIKLLARRLDDPLPFPGAAE